MGVATTVDAFAELPKVSFSYGVDDKRIKGWDFCSMLASHYNLQIFKDYEGKIEIVNLHEIYNNTPGGNEIKIEDIRFLKDNGNRKITVHQTGTDLLYNDIIVNYKRNNSTDKYQDTYVLPETYTLTKSGITITAARTAYFNGEKRTLTIDSPFIYNTIDAQRLAEWKADDQAEVHFYVSCFIDFDHYTDINSLSAQYKIGDIIYLSGDHAGIAFDSDRKFYIQNVIIPDATEINLQCKSVDPISEFSTS